VKGTKRVTVSLSPRTEERLRDAGQGSRRIYPTMSAAVELALLAFLPDDKPRRKTPSKSSHTAKSA
jgi:hypothetical protein